MNSKTWTRIITRCVTRGARDHASLAAQDEQRDQRMHHHYKLIDMGALGGPNTIFSRLGEPPKSSTIGMATGAADTLPRLWLSKAAFGVF